MRKQMNSISVVTLGLLITAFAYKLFLNPHSISVGGVTGICVLAEEHLRVPYTLSLLVLNTGLFIWGLTIKGLPYVTRSFVAMVALGLLLDIPVRIPVGLLLRSRSAAMIAGSILSGVGYGLVVSQDCSTGGSDLLGMVVTKKCPSLSTGLVMTGLDLLVVITSGFLEGAQSLFFSLVAMTLCNATLDITVYLISQTEMPCWMQVVKKSYFAVQKQVVRARVTVNPYVMALECCVFFIITHKAMLFMAEQQLIFR